MNCMQDQNENVSATAKELLRWQIWLGLILIRKFQHIIKIGVLPTIEKERSFHNAAERISSYQELIKRAACIFGKSIAVLELERRIQQLMTK